MVQYMMASNPLINWDLNTLTFLRYSVSIDYVMADRKLMVVINFGSNVPMLRLGQRFNNLVMVMSGMSSR